METLTFEGLTITVVEPLLGTAEEHALQAVWTGMSVSRDPAYFLLPWFQKLFDHAKANTFRVELHFEQLEHFNSSTIAAVIHLINDARSRSVPLVMHYAGNLRWQAASFEGLQRAMKPFTAGAGSRVDFVSVTKK